MTRPTIPRPWLAPMMTLWLIACSAGTVDDTIGSTPAAGGASGSGGITGQPGGAGGMVGGGAGVGGTTYVDPPPGGTTAISNACDPTRCHEPVVGVACCPDEQGPCGVDLGLGCVARGNGGEGELLPPGEPLPLYGSCGLPVDPGSCDAAITAWAWLPQISSCAPFAYTGCGGNENRFDTEEACIAACGDRIQIDACECDGAASTCDPSLGCSLCPQTLYPDSREPLACDAIGLHCDSGVRCGSFCDCVDDGTGAGQWVCGARLC